MYGMAKSLDVNVKASRKFGQCGRYNHTLGGNDISHLRIRNLMASVFKFLRRFR